jgi:hypothetical protein
MILRSCCKKIITKIYCYSKQLFRIYLFGIGNLVKLIYKSLKICHSGGSRNPVFFRVMDSRLRGCMKTTQNGHPERNEGYSNFTSSHSEFFTSFRMTGRTEFLHSLLRGNDKEKFLS